MTKSDDRHDIARSFLPGREAKRTRSFQVAGLLAVFLIFVPVTIAAVGKPEAAIDKIRERSLAVLEQAMQSENAFVRGAAARAAGESGDPALIPLLKKATGDVYHTTRLFALKGLQNVSAEEADALAETMAQDANVWVQGAALELLGERKRRKRPRSSSRI